MQRQLNSSWPRRRFIKQFVVASAWSAAWGKTWTANVLAELQRVAAPSPAVFRVKISEYPALAKNFGSVRISTSRVAGTSSTSIFPVIMINRASATQFHALDAACTHEGCILPTLNATSRRCECLCHGSRFGVDGALLRGPAGQALFEYPSTFDGEDTLTIEVPDFGFSVASASVQTKPGRMQLQFLAFQGIDYEVSSRADLSDPWKPTSFALTAEGPADQSIFKGQDDFANLYVSTADAAAFFAVAMRMRQV